jgi:hypothetical protein
MTIGMDASPANHEVREATPLGDAFGKDGGISMTLRPFLHGNHFCDSF